VCERGVERECRDELRHACEARSSADECESFDKSDARDVCREEVNSVAVEISTSSVIVLSCPGVGMSGEYLGVSERDPCVQCVRDRSVS
jgi:hypothetical protein